MRALLSIITFLVLVLPLVAEVDATDAREVELERLARESPKVHLQKLLDYNLSKLEAIYLLALVEAEEPEFRAALEASQEAWELFFAADGVVAAWNAKGGSSASSAQMEQKIYQVRTRIYQLSTPFHEGWPQVPRVPNPRAEQDSGGQPATRPESK